MTAPSVLAVLSLILVPFGPVQEAFQGEKHWRGFDEKGPLLTFARAETLQVSVSCQEWVKALNSVPYGEALGSGTKLAGRAEQAWEPWTDEENEWLSECDSLPCKFKLNQTETDALKMVTAVKRREEFLSLIQRRIAEYVAGAPRKGCEFPGQPIEPWELLEKSGFRLSVKRPLKGHLSVRKLDLAPGKMKPLRQVMDSRFAYLRSKSGQYDAVLWARDIYTSHYFDSWGEWLAVSCDDKTHAAAMVSGMLLELDLVKSTDLLSRLSRGRIVSAVEDQGRKYLDDEFEYLRKRANVRKSD